MPKQVLTPKRSFTARIAVLAMVFSLVAVAMPASAHSVAISTSISCPSTTPNAGFTDISAFGADVQLAINCLFMYGITNGTTATTYSPNAPVLRWQMALFLVRQAADHGLTVPAASNQGFTDIAGLPQATIDAINQIAAMEISRGTTTTTFSPNDVVSRWQMALFLHRLAGLAGVTVTDDPVHNEFGDIAGFSTETRAAINFLADGHIALGTGGSNFSPNDSVFRWSMALFLTRTLAADGVLPPAGLQVIVAPSDDVTLGSGTGRTITVTLKNADGTPYTGWVTLHIVDVNATNVAITSPLDLAENVDWQALTLSDSLGGAGTPTASGFAGTDGVVSGVIRHDGVAGEKVRVYAIRDANANGVADAGEVTGVGGLTTFAGAAVPGANNGFSGAVGVVSVNAAGDSFVGSDAAVDCGPGAVGDPCTFTYDSNDLFVGFADLAAFEAALNANDVVTVTNYATGAGGQSTFNITTDVDPTLTITSPVACTPTPCIATTVDASTFNVTGTAVVGYTVRIYTDDGDGDGGLDATDDNETLDAAACEVLVGSTIAAADGTWSILVPLLQGNQNFFFATQRSTPGGADILPYVDVPTINESASASAQLAVAVADTNGGLSGVLDGGDTLTFDFNEPMNLDFAGDSLQVTDGFDTATLTNGINATFAQGADNSIIVVTITAPLSVTVNGTGAAQNLNGWIGADGLAVNINTDPNRSFGTIA